MSGSGHLASSLDSADLFTYLYQKGLNIRADRPDDDSRDLFFLSAGHLCPAWYAALAIRGFFPEADLLDLRRFGSFLQGHPHRNVPKGIENSAGPLGQGLSQAAGAALGLQRAGSPRRVYVLTTDGEQQEGQTWESYLFAAHYALDHLMVIIDVNGIQQTGHTDDVMKIGDLSAKMKAFGFYVATCDGHDFADIDAKFTALKKKTKKPQCLICQTVPGRGISLLESDPHWHAAQPTDEQWKTIFGELAALLRDADIDLAKAP